MHYVSAFLPWACPAAPGTWAGGPEPECTMFKSRFAKPLVSFHRPLTRFETRLDCSGTVHPLSLARLIPSAGNNKLTKLCGGE